MVGGGQIFQIVRDAVRGAHVAGLRERGGPLREQCENLAVGLGVEEREVGAFARDVRGGRVAVHVAGARVRVLHVVDRVVVGVRGEQVEVDVDGRVVVGARERIA